MVQVTVSVLVSVVLEYIEECKWKSLNGETCQSVTGLIKKNLLCIKKIMLNSNNTSELDANKPQLKRENSIAELLAEQQ